MLDSGNTIITCNKYSVIIQNTVILLKKKCMNDRYEHNIWTKCTEGNIIHRQLHTCQNSIKVSYPYHCHCQLHLDEHLGHPEMISSSCKIPNCCSNVDNWFRWSTSFPAVTTLGPQYFILALFVLCKILQTRIFHFWMNHWAVFLLKMGPVPALSKWSYRISFIQFSLHSYLICGK
jgi:hypothetical protein